MAQGSSKKDPAAELRDALISALIDIQFMNALPDRRLLINLVRRDVVNFPDVHERPEARLHVVEIVLACLGHPGGLRALLAALLTMAPDAPGTRRTGQLIESATLLNLLPESEIKRVHELLRRAEQELDEPGWWRSQAQEPNLSLPGRIENLPQAFDYLGAQSVGRQRIPPALILIDRLVARLNGPLAVELGTWAEEQAERLGVIDDVRELHRHKRDASKLAGLEVLTESDGRGLHLNFEADQSADTVEGDGLEVEDVYNLDYVGTIDSTTLSMNDADTSDLAILGALGQLSPAADDDTLPNNPDARSPLGDAMPPVAATARALDRLPQVWGDVPQRDPHFIGREDLLEHLHIELSTARQTAVLPQALHGMGGVGKSYVAIEYVHRHSSEYDLVWWVSAEQTGQILDSLTKLAQRLGLNVSPEANTAVPVVREALSTGQVPYKNWLLVFDNAEAPDEVQRYFPTGGAGKILVTSRDLNWGRVAQAIEVDVFTRVESIVFLRDRNPDLSEVDASRMAEALGDLPLAIEQAAAWRAATGMPVGEYLALLEAKSIDLLDASPSPIYRRSVAAAWKVSLDKLKEINEAALQLMQICSFFAPEPISRDLFIGSPTAPITPQLDTVLSDNFQLSRAFRDIRRYALARIDHSNDTVQIHRLVQAVLVGEMNSEYRELLRRGAHTLLANNNPNNPQRRDQWDRYLALRPHVSVSRAVESTDPRVQELVLGLSKFLFFWGDHDGSERLAEEVYEYRVRDRGESDPHTLNVATWLGYMRRVTGKYTGARELNQRILDLYRAEFGENDEGTINAMNQVSHDLLATGDFAGAVDLNERGLATARQLFGDDDPMTLDCSASLGVSLRLAGDFRRAMEVDRNTYERRKVVLGSEHDRTLRTLVYLIIDIRESGDYIGAHKQQEAAYIRVLAAFDSDSPSTLSAARSLSVARRKAGDHPGARRLSQETLEKYRRRYGDDHPGAASSALNYAIDLRHAGELDMSLELGNATLARYQRNFGERHSYTLSARTNLATTLRLRGEVEAAYRHNSEALELLESTLGPDHPVTLICATNLASDLYARGDHQSAYERDTDTLARSERVLGVEHPSTLACSVNLALDLRSLRRIAEADRILADTMMSFRRVLGEKHPATLNALQSLRADCDVDPMPFL